MKKDIAIILSIFNKDISERLKAGALEELSRHKTFKDRVKWIEVPGVVEIPLTAQLLFEQNYLSVIALGAVIKGETDHYSACCRIAEQGCLKVSLKYSRPIVFGILMTDNKEQALARTGGKKGHIGKSAVCTAVKMLALKKQFI